MINHAQEPIELTVRLDADSDFADLFEIKDAVGKKGKYYHRVEDGPLLLGYSREQFARETKISATAPATVDENGLTFQIHTRPAQHLDHRPRRGDRDPRLGRDA